MLRIVKKIAVKLLIAVPVILLLYQYPFGGNSQQIKTVAPSHIQAVIVESGLAVSWKPVPGALSYTIFWGTEKGEYKSLFNTDRPGVVLANLRKGDLYYLAVTSWTKNGESNYSQEQILVYDDMPSHARAHLARGNEFMQKGALAEAYAHISVAIQLDPVNPEAYKDRALLYEKAQRPELAKRDYATAEKLYKKKPISFVPTRPSDSY
ncbi:MAG TPA: hypothetical protein VK463_06035 [Desulfomonilaceae bacterium]|nr:hypothetical protein [Desulfomonilaceae bacterium]